VRVRELIPRGLRPLLRLTETNRAIRLWQNDNLYRGINIVPRRRASFVSNRSIEGLSLPRARRLASSNPRIRLNHRR